VFETGMRILLRFEGTTKERGSGCARSPKTQPAKSKGRLLSEAAPAF